MINKTVSALAPENMQAEFLLIFDGMKTSYSYVLVQLLAHLNYHLGQVNYPLPRLADPGVGEA